MSEREPPSEIAADIFQSWSAARYEVRLWMRRSEEISREFGLPPQQHQLLLAIKGFPAPPPHVTDLAERMQLREHSTVELLNRMERRGLIRRQTIEGQRGVFVTLTPEGEALLLDISLRLQPHIVPMARRLIRALTSLSAECGSLPAGARPEAEPPPPAPHGRLASDGDAPRDTDAAPPRRAARARPKR